VGDARGKPGLAPEKRAEVADEIADVLIYLTELADVLASTRSPRRAPRSSRTRPNTRRPYNRILPKALPMSHFKHHVFFCTNQRAAGEACCNNHGASDMRAYAKDKVKALGASCRARCASTPPAASTAANRGRCW
jgi:hypothetical protein